jgi:DNA-binding NarL/FixJ family response regulator
VTPFDGLHSGRTIRLAVVEDESLLRDLLRTALGSYAGIEVIGDYERPADALEAIPGLDIDVVVLDIELGSDMNGIELGVRLRRMLPHIGILLLSNHADPQLLSSLPNDVIGGWSYLLKRSVTNVASLTRAIQGAASGLLVFDPELTRQTRPRKAGPTAALSARQREILGLIAEGYSNGAIADRLGLSERSIENHISRIYTTLGVDSTDRSVHARVRAVLTFVQDSVTVPG